MDWQKLELSKASLIKKEVDGAITQLNDNSPGNEQLISKAHLVHTIQARIQELENFYIRNNDDDRAILFEKERLRLRKALQAYNASIAPASRDSKSVTSGGFDRDANYANSGMSITSNQNRAISSNNSRASHPQQSSMSATTPNIVPQMISPVPPVVQRITKITTPLGSQNGIRSISGNVSVTSAGTGTNRRTSPTTAPIYAWEQPQQQLDDRRHADGSILVDNIAFIPTATNGFYNRAPINYPTNHGPNAYNLQAALSSAAQPLSDKYCDFQIILTQEELNTLASRKKSEVRADSKLNKAAAAAMSVHSTTPYIENRRIVNEMLRPVHQEKWVHKDGIRAYKRL